MANGTIRIYPKPELSDSLYVELLSTVPDSKFYNKSSVMVPFSEGPAKYIIETSRYTDLVYVKVNGTEQFRGSPATPTETKLNPLKVRAVVASEDELPTLDTMPDLEAGDLVIIGLDVYEWNVLSWGKVEEFKSGVKVVPNTSESTGFHIELEVPLTLQRGANLIEVGIVGDPTDTYALSVTASSWAGLLRGYSNSLYTNLFVKLEQETTALTSQWSPRFIEHLLNYRKLLPDLKNPHTHAIKLAVKSAMNHSGTEQGVRDFAAALTYNNPILKQFTNKNFLKLNSHLVSRQDEKFGMKFYSWFPSLNLAKWMAFAKLMENIPSITKLSNVTLSEIDVFTNGAASTLEQHRFDAGPNAIGPDFKGILDEYPRLDLNLFISRAVTIDQDINFYTYDLNQTARLPLGVRWLGQMGDIDPTPRLVPTRTAGILRPEIFSCKYDSQAAGFYNTTYSFLVTSRTDTTIYVTYTAESGGSAGSSYLTIDATRAYHGAVDPFEGVTIDMSVEELRLLQTGSLLAVRFLKEEGAAVPRNDGIDLYAPYKEIYSYAFGWHLFPLTSTRFAEPLDNKPFPAQLNTMSGIARNMAGGTPVSHVDLSDAGGFYTPYTPPEGDPPVITNFFPTLVSAGDEFVIEGTGLANVTLLRVGTTAADVVPFSNTDTQVIAVVPSGLTPGDFTIEVNTALGTDTDTPLTIRPTPVVGCPAPGSGVGVSKAAPIDVGLTVTSWSYGNVQYPHTLQVYDPYPDLVTHYIWNHAGHTVTKLQDGRHIVVGGSLPVSTSPLNTYIWSADFTSCTAGPNSLVYRTDHRAVLLADGRLLVVGGASGEARAEILTADASAWAFAGAPAQGRTNPGLIALPDGRALLIGGYSGQVGAHVGTVDIWSNGTWTSVASMDTPRGYPLCIVLPNGKVLVVGGYAFGDEFSGVVTELYDPDLDTWSYQEDCPYTVNTDAGIELLSDGRVLVFGGRDALWNGTPTSTKFCAIFDPDTGTWSTAPSMKTMRVASWTHATNGPGRCKLADGTIVVVGGIGASYNGGTPSVELRDPITGEWRYGAYTLTSEVIGPFDSPAQNTGYLAVVNSTTLAFFSGEGHVRFATLGTAPITVAPEITTFDFNRGGVDSTIVIHGTRLWDIESGTINGVPDSLVISGASGTQVSAIVTVNALSSGPLAIYNGAGVATTTEFQLADPTPDTVYPTDWAYRKISVFEETIPRAGVVIESDDNSDLSLNTTKILRCGGVDAMTVDPGMGGIAGEQYEVGSTVSEIWGVLSYRLSNGTPFMVTGTYGHALQLKGTKVLAIGGVARRYYDYSGWTDVGDYPMANRPEDPVGRFFNVQVFDIPTETWANASAQLNVPRYNATTVLLTKGTHAGKVLVIGGCDQALKASHTSDPTFPYAADDAPYLRSVERGDETGWTLVAPLPISVTYTLDAGYFEYGTENPFIYFYGRANASAIELDDGRVFVTGGEKSSIVVDYSSLIYDPEADTWTVIPHEDLSRYGQEQIPFGGRPVLTKLLDGRIFIWANPGSGPYSVNIRGWVYDPLRTGAEAWMPVANGLSHDSRGFTAHLMENGTVMLVGQVNDGDGGGV